jgi:hypothetical protein
MGSGSPRRRTGWREQDEGGFSCRQCRRSDAVAAQRNSALKQDLSAEVIVVGHGFVRDVRRGHYELAVEEPMNRRVAVAFDELAVAI